jgi:hypothetical protein
MVTESNAASAADGVSGGGCVVAFQPIIGAQIAVLSVSLLEDHDHGGPKSRRRSSIVADN